MPPQRRQSTTSKAPQQSTTPSIISTPTLRPSASSHPPSKLKIHPLLETYEATIAALIGTLSEDPFRPESIHEVTRRLLQCESDLEDALEELKQYHENTLRIQQLQQQNAELSRRFSTNLTSLSEARTVLSSLPDSQPATIDNKIPYQQLLEFASKISKFTSPPPQWDPSRPQQPGSYVPWPSEDAMRRGRLAQLAVEGLPEPSKSDTSKDDTQDTEMEESRPRRNPGRRATSVESRRRKMSQAGEPKPITLREREKEIDFGLDLFNPDEDT